jgi:hypothetical protein
MKSDVWTNAAVVIFQVNTSYTLEVKGIQFRLLFTIIFAAVVGKNTNKHCGSG